MEERRDIVYNRNRSHPYAPGESKKGSRRFDGAGRIDEKTGVFTEFNGCSGRRTAGEYYALIGNRRHGASKLAGWKNCHAGSLKD